MDNNFITGLAVPNFATRFYTQSYRKMTDKISFEAVPQIVARLEDKVDALTETVTKLLTEPTARQRVSQ